MQWPKENGQTIIYKTLHWKLTIGHREPHYNPEVNSGVPKG